MIMAAKGQTAPVKQEEDDNVIIIENPEVQPIKAELQESHEENGEAAIDEPRQPSNVGHPEPAEDFFSNDLQNWEHQGNTEVENQSSNEEVTPRASPQNREKFACILLPNEIKREAHNRNLKADEERLREIGVPIEKPIGQRIVEDIKEELIYVEDDHSFLF